MIEWIDITGLFSTVLCLTTLFSLLFPLKRFRLAARLLIIIVFIGLLVIPLGSVSAAAYVRGFIGDLSVTSLVFLGLAISGTVFDFKPISKQQTDLFCLLLFPPSLVFYPLATGLGKHDPYAFGYGSLFLLGLVFLVTLLAWATEQFLIASTVSLAVFCYAIGWYESNNLWDYLVDPLVALYALGASVNRYLLWGNARFRDFIEAAMNE